MKTVTKALALLDLFSEAEPEFGLTALARKAGLDKATTLRLLRAMKGQGFIEQDAHSRRYRLGASLLRLAHLRETIAPIKAPVQPILQKLANATGETVHAALAAGNSLATVATARSKQSSGSTTAPGLKLPLHATASGIAYLAFAPPGTLDHILRARLERYTDMTTTDPDDVRRLVETAQSGGVGSVDRGFDENIVDLAAPLFDGLGHAQGAVAVITPISRMSLNVRREQSALLIQAALDCADVLKAKPPEQFLNLAAKASE